MNKFLKYTLWFSIPALLLAAIYFGLQWKLNPSLTPEPIRSPNLVVAVAPFSTNQYTPAEGVQVQEAIATHLEKDLGLKVIRLKLPVQVGPMTDPDLNMGFKDADKLIAENSADLLVWGTEGNVQLKTWNTYVSTSVQAKCLARDQGFGMNQATNLDNLTNGNILDVMDYVTETWEGLIEHSEGMDISPKVKTMVDKIDTVLGLGPAKGWGKDMDLAIKRQLAYFLSSYASETKDVKALMNSIRLAEEVMTNSQLQNPETKQPFVDTAMLNVIGSSSFYLGNLSTDPSYLQKSADAYRTIIKDMGTNADPLDLSVYQIGLGMALAELGQKTSDPASIQEAITNFEAAEKVTDRRFMPHLWLSVQTGLGACYTFLGHKAANSEFIKKALDHFLLAETDDAQVKMPDDYATAEANIGMIYFELGSKEENPEDFKQAIIHSDKAVAQFQAIGNPYNTGFSMTDKGKAQFYLSRYTEDEELLKQSLETMKGAQKLIPLEQDPETWVENQVQLARAQALLSTKTLDAKGLEESEAMFQKAISLFDPVQRFERWSNLTVLLCSTQLTEFSLDCDDQRRNPVIHQIEELQAKIDPAQQALRFMLFSQILAAAYDDKSVMDQDPLLAHKALRVMNVAMKTLSPDASQQTKNSMANAMAGAYSELLLQDPDKKTLRLAKTLAVDFEKNALNIGILADQAVRWIHAAKLERAIARSTKERDRLDIALGYSHQALTFYQSHGYVVSTAFSQREIGDENLLAGQLTGDTRYFDNAIESYTQAQTVFKTRCICISDRIAKNLAKAKRLKKTKRS